MCGLFLFLTIRTIIFKEISFLSCVIIYLATSTYLISIQRTFFIRKLFRFPICIILAYIRTKFGLMNDKRFFRTKIFRTVRFLESFSVFLVVLHLFHDKILLSSSLNFWISSGHNPHSPSHTILLIRSILRTVSISGLIPTLYLWYCRYWSALHAIKRSAHSHK